MIREMSDIDDRSSPSSQRVVSGLTELISSSGSEIRDVEVVGLNRISEGYSRENWVFDAEWSESEGRVSLPLIMRRDPVGSLIRTDRETEFRILKALKGSGLPVPKVLWFDPDGSHLDRPAMVMVREQGRCDWHVLNGVSSLESRLDIARQFIDLLADVHAVDWKTLGLEEVLHDAAPNCARTELRHWEEEFRVAEIGPCPELELVLDWLGVRAPLTPASVLVHGDYKPGNVLLEGQHISTLLDWELTHLGDPLEDLGWLTNPYRAKEQQIAGAWERKQIVDRYTARRGIEVSSQDLTWWNIFSCFKLGVIILTGVGAFVRGSFDRIYQFPAELLQMIFQLMAEFEDAETP